MWNIKDQIKLSKVGSQHQINCEYAQFKTKVSSQQLLDSLLIASRMQTEMYIHKMSKGQALNTEEVSALKDLANIAKIKLDDIDMMLVNTPETIHRSKIHEAVFNMLNKNQEESSDESY